MYRPTELHPRREPNGDHPKRTTRIAGRPSSVEVVPHARMLGSVFLLAVALAVTGCGSSDDAATETAATAGTSAGSGAAQRLSPQSWSNYVVARTKAKAVNTAALHRWAKCRAVASAGAPSARVQACLGNSMSTVVSAGEDMRATLQRLESDVSGRCGTKLDDLSGMIKLYIASVNAGQTALEGGGVGDQTGFDDDLDNSRQALVRARAQEPPFEAACKPT